VVADADSIARWLECSPEVIQVRYPGLASHPDAAVAERTWRPGRRGAMVAFVVDGGNDRAAKFLRALNVIREATSLGGVETLISAPHNSSQFSYTPKELDLADIKPGMVRLSVGIEDPAQLLADLDQASSGPPHPPRPSGPSRTRRLTSAAALQRLGNASSAGQMKPEVVACRTA
jgi:cystathionine beta-lyase/cystathionine gamma-synthase